MDLKTYIATHGVAELSKVTGKNAVYLRQIANGHRRASGALAIAIDKGTSGSVTAEEIRSDIDFAYLRQSGERPEAEHHEEDA